MKRNISLLFFFMGCSFLFSAFPEINFNIVGDPVKLAIKQNGNALDELQEELDRLRGLDSILKIQYDFCLKRKFQSAPKNKEELDSFLRDRPTLEALLQDSALIKQSLDKYPDYKYVKSYKAIFTMYSILDALYNENNTDRCIDYVDNIDEQYVSEVHRTVFDKLKENVIYYRSAVFELGRIIKYAKDNRINKINLLDERGKTDGIKDYPYLRRMLEQYLGNSINPMDFQELKRSCPEAFQEL